MKTGMMLVMLLLVTGCAAPDGFQFAQVQNEHNLRDQRRLPMTFAQIQQALFLHQRECGEAPTFSVGGRQGGDGMVVQSFDNPPRMSRTVVVDLETINGWDGERIVARAYAQNQVTKAEVDQVFKAILRPEECPVR